jgi:hypothetical protein
VIEKPQGNRMADAKWAAFSYVSAALFHLPRKDITMVEILMMAQLAQKPLQAMARRWYCRSLFRATRGARGCAESTAD